MASLLRRFNPAPAPAATSAPAFDSTKPAAPSPIPGSHVEDDKIEYDKSSQTQPEVSLSSLPPELHLLVASYLIYPDALSLKHTNRHFYNLVDTGIKLKIDWLVERRRLHLECPNNTKCDLGSDLRFCRGSVRLLMQRRREHMECESRPGLGCLIYGTPTCPQRRRFGVRLKRWLRFRVAFEMWWVLVALVPIVLWWVWTGGAAP